MTGSGAGITWRWCILCSGPGWEVSPVFIHCPSPPYEALSTVAVTSLAVARCWPQNMRSSPSAAQSPNSVQPIRLRFATGAVDSAVDQFTEDSVPECAAHVLGSNPDSALSPHSRLGSWLSELPLLQGIPGHQEGGKRGMAGLFLGIICLA